MPAFQENDFVALRERVGDWPGETKGTAVSIHDDAALVEVPEDVPPGRTLDLFVPPVRGDLARWRSGCSFYGSLMEASDPANGSQDDPQATVKSP
jgi:hypothetical protein